MSFLTRVPVAAWMILDARDVARGSIFFPVVGAVIGGATALVAIGLAKVLPLFLAAAVAVAFHAAITGAIHLDAQQRHAAPRREERALEEPDRSGLA